MKILFSVLALLSFLTISIVNNAHLHEVESIEDECSVCLLGVIGNIVITSEVRPSKVLETSFFKIVNLFKHTQTYKLLSYRLHYSRGPPAV